jgi:glycosyltransferase involved in cell wall biosynthesis
MSETKQSSPGSVRVAVMCSAHSLGDERVVSRQALSLAKLGYEVAVFGRDDPTKVLPRHQRLRLVPVVPMAYGPSLRSRIKRFQALGLLGSAVRQFQPDIVACHEPDTALLAVLRLRGLGCAIHFDVHEYFEEVAAARSPLPLCSSTRSLTRMGLRAIAARCDWITVVSPAIVPTYAEVVGEERVAVLLNSHPVEDFPLCNHAVAGPVTVLHDGWLDDSRGMKQMLEALAFARKSFDVRLLFVGKVRESCVQRFNYLVRQLDLVPHVEVTGWIPYDRLGETDARAQVGLLALQPTGNNFGGLSNKVYSYMSCGQPAIVPQGSASAELIRHYDSGIAVDITQPAVIAEAIVALARNATLRKRLGLNGRRAVETELGWHKMEDKLRLNYAELSRLARQRKARIR